MPSFVCRIKANQHSHNLQDIGCVCHGEAKKQARCVASGSAFLVVWRRYCRNLLAVPVLTPDRQLLRFAASDRDGSHWTRRLLHPPKTLQRPRRNFRRWT